MNKSGYYNFALTIMEWHVHGNDFRTSCLMSFSSRPVSLIKNSMLLPPFSTFVSLLEMSPGILRCCRGVCFDVVGRAPCEVALPSSRASLWSCNFSFRRKSVVSFITVSIFDIALEMATSEPLIHSSLTLPLHVPATALRLCFTCSSKRRT